MAETDKFTILAEKVKALGDDADGNLTIKVSKKDTAIPGGLFRPTLVCSLTGGRVGHVLNPELWLPRLMGGGRFTLAVFPPGMATAAIVDGIDVELTGEPRSFPDLNAPEDSSWAGPREIIYPSKRAVQSATNPPPLSIAAPPPSVTTPLAAPQQPLGMGGSGVAPPDDTRRLHEYYAQQINALSQRLIDEQHKREIDALATGQQRELAAMKAEIEKAKEAASKAPPPVRGPSFADILREATPIVAPLLTAWMSSQAERERRQEERDRRADERWAEMMKAMTARPAIDPALKELLDQSRAEQLPMGAILQQTAQATATMTASMMDMVQRMAEMNAGPEESPMIKVVREVGSAIQGIAASAANSAQGPKPRRLPRQEGSAPPAPAPTPAAPPNLQVVKNESLGDAPQQGVLDRIKSMLLEHADPNLVADECVKAFGTAEFQAALKAAKYEPLEMFKALLGEAWLLGNAVYVTEFGKAFTEKGRAAGIFQENEEEGDDGDGE